MEQEAKLRKLGFQPHCSDNEKEKEIYIFHNEYIMSLACIAAQRSPDPVNQVGAVIINQDRRIVGIGYNDFPVVYETERIKHFQLPLDEKYGEGSLNTKHPYLIEAASNAILNKNSSSLKGCTMYTTMLPSNESFKLVVQSGITKVYYITDRPEESFKGSQVMSIFCGVELQEYAIFNKTSIKFKNFKSEAAPKTSDSGDEKNSSEIPYHLDIPSGFKPNPNGTKPREVLSADDFFMAVAYLTRRRSKDPVFKVGACVVDDHQRIVSCGYNGFPNGAKDQLPWNKEGKEKTVNNKHMYVCHAELNALVNNYDTSVAGCTLYVTLFPCQYCAQIIVQSQIKKVIYASDEKSEKDEFKASRVLFAKYGVVTIKFSPKVEEIKLETSDNASNVSLILTQEQN